MLLNPYEAPIEALDEKQSQAHLVLTTIGLLFGGLCDALGGFVGGALVGLTYRLFHDISFGGDGILGLFERVDTPLEWALFHATLGTFPLALLGFVFGSIHGLCAARIRFGVGGIVAFSFLGLLVGLLNGISAADGGRWARHMVEGPIAGAVFGCTAAAIAWTIFCLRMKRVTQNRDERMPFLLHTLLAISVGFLLLCAITLSFGLGNDALQITSRFGAIIAIASVAAILWKKWRFRTAVQS